MDKLVLLVSMSNSALDRCIDGLGAGEIEGKRCLPRVARTLLRKKVSDARKKAFGGS